MIHKIKTSYVNLVRFPRYLSKDLHDCNSVLDIGCGSGTFLRMGWLKRPVSYTGLDVFKPYLMKAKRLHATMPTRWIEADVGMLPIKKSSFDAVIAFEVLEHLEKTAALRVVKETEKISKRKVLIIVPNGVSHQSEYDGNPFQAHRSSWLNNDLKALGYDVKGIYGLSELRGERGVVKNRPKILWEFVSDFSQFVIRGNSCLASHLYAVKDLQS